MDKNGRKRRHPNVLPGASFPKLEVTITELVRTGQYFADGKSLKVNAVLEEKDGKSILIINKSEIKYAFPVERGVRFHVLKLNGRFIHDMKANELTGDYKVGVAY